MLAEISKDVKMGTMMGRKLFSISPIGKSIVQPIGEKSAIVTYSDGSGGTNHNVGPEFEAGIRVFLEVNEHSEPIPEFDVSDLDGAEFVVVKHGVLDNEPALITHHRTDGGVVTGMITLTTGSGNSYTYMAQTIHNMIDRGDILVYRAYE